MARIYPTQQFSNQANFVRRLYKLSQNDTVREAGGEATRAVSKLIDAVRSVWPSA